MPLDWFRRCLSGEVEVRLVFVEQFYRGRNEVRLPAFDVATDVQDAVAETENVAGVPVLVGLKPKRRLPSDRNRAFDQRFHRTEGVGHDLPPNGLRHDRLAFDLAHHPRVLIERSLDRISHPCVQFS